MANEKITDLGTLTSVASDDVLEIVDTSSNTSKQVAASDLVALADTLYGIQTGWRPVSDTWAYASYDSTNKTGTITVPTDATTKYQPGMRVKFTNNSATQYGIVTKVTSTVLTVYFGTDYSLTNSAITSIYYSSSKAPVGFPLDPAKWTVSTVSTSNTSGTGSNGVWANTSALSVAVPIGVWELSHKSVSAVTASTSSQASVYTSLSTATNSESNPEFTTGYNAASATTLSLISAVYVSDLFTVTSPTTMYLIHKPNGSGTLTTGCRGDIGKTVIKAVCAYL